MVPLSNPGANEPSATFQLMSLPAELRLGLYEHIIEAAFTTALSDSTVRKLALLRANMQVRAEALPIFRQVAERMTTDLYQEIDQVYVENHLYIDPDDQRLYLQDRDGVSRWIRYGLADRLMGGVLSLRRGYIRVLNMMVDNGLAQEDTASDEWLSLLEVDSL